MQEIRILLPHWSMNHSNSNFSSIFSKYFAHDKKANKFAWSISILISCKFYLSQLWPTLNKYVVGVRGCARICKWISRRIIFATHSRRYVARRINRRCSHVLISSDRHSRRSTNAAALSILFNLLRSVCTVRSDYYYSWNPINQNVVNQCCQIIYTC